MLAQAGARRYCSPITHRALVHAPIAMAILSYRFAGNGNCAKLWGPVEENHDGAA
jgi:hypothetical protein